MNDGRLRSPKVLRVFSLLVDNAKGSQRLHKEMY